MRHYKHCPECEHHDECEQVFEDQYSDKIEQVFICDRCEIQWSAHYGLDYKEVDISDV